jgi:hypothetical protein
MLGINGDYFVRCSYVRAKIVASRVTDENGHGLGELVAGTGGLAL